MPEDFKNLRTLITFLKNFFSKTVLRIQGKVDVDFPETQKVEVINQQKLVNITPNLDGLGLKLDTLQTSLREVVTILNKPMGSPEELKPELVRGLSAVKKAVENIKL